MLRSVPLVLASITAVACAPMSTSRRTKDVSRPDRIVRGAPEKGKAALTVTAAPDGFVIASTDELVCRTNHIKVVERTEIHTRKVNKPVTVFEYVLGVALAAPGVYAVAAPQDAVDRTGAPLTADQMRVSGAIGASLGGMFLLFGVVNSFRGGTTENTIGLVESLRPGGEQTACGSSPRNADPIALSVGPKNITLGNTDSDGSLKVAFDTITPDVFDANWRAAAVVGPHASTSINLEQARVAVAQRELVALTAAPTIDGARLYRVRFGRDPKSDALLLQLADAAYAPLVTQALEAGDLEAAKKTLVLWSADAPESTMLVASRAHLDELERVGPAEYHHARFLAASATASTDPKRYVEADHALLALAKVAPSDARIAAGRKKLDEHKKALVALANKHVDQAKTFAGNKQWAEADVEIAKAKEAAFDDKATLARIQRVEAKRPAGMVAATTTPTTTPTTDTKVAVVDEKARKAEEAKAAREEKLRLAAEAKAARDAEKARKAEEAKAAREEKLRVAAEAKAAREAEKQRKADEAKAKREEEARVAAEAKAKREEEAKIAAAKTADEKAALAAQAKARREEQARLDAEAKAKTEAEAKAKREEQARLAAEAKAKADEERARIAAEKARSAEEKKAADDAKRAAAAETARLAAEEKKRKAAETARLAAAAERARKDAAAERARKPGARVPAATTTSVPAMPGLWAAVLGHSIWLLDLQADGSGKTAVFGSGRVLAMQDIRWQIENGSLSVAAGSSSIRGPIRQDAAKVDWVGVAWKRQ